MDVLAPMMSCSMAVRQMLDGRLVMARPASGKFRVQFGCVTAAERNLEGFRA